MKNKWLLQSSGFYTTTLEDVVSSVKSLGIFWADFGIVENNITNLENIIEPNFNYITRGGIKLLKLLTKENISLMDLNENISKEQNSKFYLNKLIKSIDYDIQMFDQNYYKSFNIPLLNLSASYVPYQDLMNEVFNKPMFIKPSRDLKSFNGGIIQSGETLLNYIKRNGYTKDIEDEIIIVSELKEIYSEYRFFMYKNTILGCSRYILNGKVNPDIYVPNEFKECVVELAKHYQPNDFYVIDLADTSKGIKIVEYNCWNCSGFYYSDIKNIIFTINEIKEGKNEK